ncbi:hypothetical protein BELL_0063g00040 [Botrytis elliptica]|uniref:DUF7730 domain-containing protein n=1 Tax=Botrytis elliptica TaxID=278938 RepID=A0A4Z1JZB4_9HELO|nr:hypothetical protein EAE99_011361 [Botrytis elliptica]TGO78524.1 hypothetical protein BELL_0063g00040 [Botrytis elliptica]
MPFKIARFWKKKYPQLLVARQTKIDAETPPSNDEPLSKLEPSSNDEPRSKNELPGLLRLPLEIRQMIYVQLLKCRPMEIQFPYRPARNSRPLRIHISRECEIYTGFSTHILLPECHIEKLTTGLLRVSQQISDEALDVLYGHNKFTLLFYSPSWFNHSAPCILNAGNMKRIRDIHMICERRILLKEYSIMNLELWVPLLANVSRFEIFVQNPLARSKFDAEEGIDWIEPLLMSVAEISGTRPRVTVDDDERSASTINLVTKCFGTGYGNLALSMEES